MKRFFVILLVAALMGSATAGYAAPVQQSEPYSKVTYRCILKMDPKVAKPGDTVAATGAGFAPFSTVTITVFDGTTLTTKANSAGSIAFNFFIPAGTKDGIYSVRAEGPIAGDPEGTLVSACKIEVKAAVASAGERVQPGRDELPMTGGAVLWVVLIAGLALAAAGFGIKIARKS